ncbi:MAG: CRISPR-associated protein Cas4 [Dehalococcoidia bacterium]
MVTETAAAPEIQFTVTDLRQFGYCRRIPFFTMLSTGRRPTTFKMDNGISAHEREAALAERRTLRAYGIVEGSARFEVSLYSARLGLSGRLDMLIESGDETIPVDFKNGAGAVGTNHRYQLAAYSLLLEDVLGVRVRRGFIYQVPEKRAVEVVLEPSLRTHVRRVLSTMRRMIAEEAMPPATEQRGRCVDCEFRRFCNDVW